MKNLLRALAFLGRYRLPAGGMFASLLLVNAANLLAPQLLRLLIDEGIGALNLARALQAAGLLVALALGRGLFNFLQGYWSEVASQGVAYDLRNAIFGKLQGLSFSYHDRAQTGKLMTRVTSDVELVRQFAGMGLLQVLAALTLLTGTLVILFRMNAALALITLGIVPFILVVLLRFVTRVMPVSKRVQQKLGALNSILQENLAGMRVVKAFTREDFEQARFLNANQELLEENMGLMRIFSGSFPLIFFFANLGTVAVVWAGGLQVLDQALTLGELVAFTGYLGYLLTPLFMLGMVGAMFSRAEVSAGRIFEVIDAASEVQDLPGAYDLPPLAGEVAFENVDFRYMGGESNVLSGVSFTAAAGQRVAILGETGSGKSTIINLIPRFYEATAGRVSVDGHDVRAVRLESLRAQIGIVLQETKLFSGTIRDNIAYGKPEAALEEVQAAARSAQAHEFIEQLEAGYATVVGESGVGLSGGQKQRIAIARALLVDPRILILDDSTSAVDAETEYKIRQALDRLMQGRTSFVIAQRLSTVRDADLILLLEGGRLVDQGTHRELLERSDLYNQILDTQFGEREPLSSPQAGAALEAAP